jgi:hypothetical protein
MHDHALVRLMLYLTHAARMIVQEIRELKQELAMHDALSGRNRVQYDPYSDEQRFQLAENIKK